ISVTTATNAATTGGGSITIGANGAFTYTPPLGQDSGTDTYTYTGTAHSVARTATITFNISNVVWYVNPNAGVNGNGQSQAPWNATGNIKQQPTAGGANTGDIIYVYNGGALANRTANIPLLANQTLIGEGVALVVNSVTLRAAGTKPSLTASSANVVSVTNGNTITGLTLTGSTNALISGAPAGLTVDTRDMTPSGPAHGVHHTRRGRA